VDRAHHARAFGAGILALIRHPAECERLRARPELLPIAIDECLRFDGPIVLTVRTSLFRVLARLPVAFDAA
jgi:cytochrome P450